MGSSEKVAIQGEPGSNSHVAARQIFLGRPEFDLMPCSDSAQVFAVLAGGNARWAVLPIENTLHGSVFEHYDLLLQHDVSAVAEVLLPVRHNVIVAPGVRFAEIRRVLSHPVALSQCRRWLREHPGIEAMPVYDTAGAVKLLMAQGLRDTVALAPELAAEIYGGEVLERSVEDHRENYTRFYVLERGSAGRSWSAHPTKASLAFRLEHRPGSLMRALAVCEKERLNLTRIESRPVPGSPWEYVFFVDVRFEDEAQLDRALQPLDEVCTSLRVLGRYAAG